MAETLLVGESGDGGERWKAISDSQLPWIKNVKNITNEKYQNLNSILKYFNNEEGTRESLEQNFNFNFAPYSGFSPGTPVFTHYTFARRWYAPHDMAMINNSKFERVTEMGIKKYIC